MDSSTFSPIHVDGKNETDETECEQWECHNIYTHCNGEWNCPNGEDEIGCYSAPPINCSQNHRPCVSPLTNRFLCLPMSRMNDGKVDCLGGTDETKLCPLKRLGDGFEYNVYCMNQTFSNCVYRIDLCNRHDDCEHGDDEQFCEVIHTDIDYSFCMRVSIINGFDVEKYFCTRPDLRERIPLPALWSLVRPTVENVEHLSSSIFSVMSDQPDTPYDRGLGLRVWLNEPNKPTSKTSLCPSSFYGDQCQYQNQRVSLTIQFRTLSDSYRTLFTIIISLIDHSDQRMIHSYEQITFLWFVNCQTRFHFYLLYSTRPKDLTKTYSIHIDFYEKLSSAYRGSLLLPVNFPFLPVQQQVFLVDIPRVNDKIQSCSHHQCDHGKCIRYSNDPQHHTFCQGDPGWSGEHCHISHICTCSSGSTCLGSAANNRSICLCPPNRFGPRCLLTDAICHTENNSQCEYGGRCIPNDGYLVANRNFACICRIGSSGDRCEIVDAKLILSFDRDVIFVTIHIYSLL